MWKRRCSVRLPFYVLLAANAVSCQDPTQNGGTEDSSTGPDASSVGTSGTSHTDPDDSSPTGSATSSSSTMSSMTSTSSASTSNATDTTTGSTTDSNTEGDTSSPDGDAFVADVEVRVNDDVRTILIVEWEQRLASDDTWIEYSFDPGEWLQSPALPGTLGDHQQVLLGIPGDTEVTFRFVNRTGEGDGVSEEYQGTTGTVPATMPRPTVESYDRALASPHRWMFGGVEDTQNIGGQGNFYAGPFWLYIIDRQGRIVWYYVDLGDNPTSAFPRITPNGHIAIEKRQFSDTSYEPSVLHMTLDRTYEDDIDVPDLDDCIDFTDDGSLLYNVLTSYDQEPALMEMSPDGTIREIWNCNDWLDDNGISGQNACYSNTVSWNRADDTVLMSMPYLDTIVEIDRQSGELVGQYGQANGSWPFEGSSYEWSFEFNHFANIGPDGTLFVSSHEPGHGGPNASSGNATENHGTHMFLEFELDRVNQRVIERWFYVAEQGEWPRYKGMVMPIEGGDGNVIANVGTGGTILEITPDGDVAFRVLWDADFDEPLDNKMVGHNILVDDLYALNRQPDESP